MWAPSAGPTASDLRSALAGRPVDDSLVVPTRRFNRRDGAQAMQSLLDGLAILGCGVGPRFTTPQRGR